MPASHGAQVTFAGPGAYMPAAHGVHPVRPALGTAPPPQPGHTLCPSTAVYPSGGHSWQAANPAADAYVPAPQAWHDLMPVKNWYVPGTHAMHALEA